MLAIDAIVLSALYLTEPREVVYSRSVPQVLENASSLQFRPQRVEGALVAGSLYRVSGRCEFRFSIAATRDSAAMLPVRYVLDLGYPWSRRDCALPDTFCDAPPFDFTTIVQGKLEYDASGLYFSATQVMTRCPAKYEMRNGQPPPPCPPVPVRA